MPVSDTQPVEQTTPPARWRVVAAYVWLLLALPTSVLFIVMTFAFAIALNGLILLFAVLILSMIIGVLGLLIMRTRGRLTLLYSAILGLAMNMAIVFHIVGYTSESAIFGARDFRTLIEVGVTGIIVVAVFVLSKRWPLPMRMPARYITIGVTWFSLLMAYIDRSH